MNDPLIPVVFAILRAGKVKSDVENDLMISFWKKILELNNGQLIRGPQIKKNFCASLHMFFVHGNPVEAIIKNFFPPVRDYILKVRKAIKILFRPT
jgi:hypothetical protein